MPNITFIAADDVRGDARVSVFINGTNRVLTLTKEAVEDFLGLPGNQPFSTAAKVEEHWDRFKPQLEALYRENGPLLDVVTTQLLNGQ